MKKLSSLLCAAAITFSAMAQKEIKIGIIGLDTSHSTAFTELLNGDDKSDPYVRDFEVVAAYPYGSRTIESSYNRIPGYIEEVKKHGVKITNSITELLDMVDCVLLETNDGRLHLEQAEEVFKSGKICYIDKPLGATLGQAMAIYDVAKEYDAPIFSSSALRFSPVNVELREGKHGPILGADCYYTLMGPGCVEVNRMSSPDQADVVVGKWADGRIGTFRGIVSGPAIYGGTAFTPDGAVQAGGYAGYKVLLNEILDYFKTGKAPVTPEETIEIFAFMKASNMSRERNGAIVTLDEARAEGRREADELLAKRAAK